MESEAYLYGRNPVIEALEAGKKLSKIFIDFGTHGSSINRIYSLAKKEGIPCIRHDKKKFSELERKAVPKNEKSQGVIALAEIVGTIDLEELIELAYEGNTRPVIVALDEISDPHNFGAIARSAEASGAAGIIIPERNSSPITPTVVKASAGAIEHLPVAKVGNLATALAKLKDRGFWVIGTDLAAEKKYTDNIYDRPVVLVIGSEGKGIRPVIRKNCDMNVVIPMAGSIQSLNASVSAGIILFEMLRQRSK